MCPSFEVICSENYHPDKRISLSYGGVRLAGVRLLVVILQGFELYSAGTYQVGLLREVSVL